MWVFLSRTNCFFSELLCGPKSNHEGRPEYIPKRLQKNDLSYISGARVCFLILGVWTRGTFSKRRFFFAMRQNCSDDACAMHACWGRFSKKHRLLIFFSFSSQEQIINVLSYRQQKRNPGICFRLMTLGNYLFLNLKKD